MNHPHLPDLRNLRDVGGLRTRDGRRVRSGVVLRSATPFFLDATQAHALVDDLGIRTRVDLRSEVEIEELPNTHVSSLPHQAVHLPLRSGGEWTHHTDPVDRNEAVAAHYARYLRHSPSSITRIVALAADPGSAAMLVHCSAGKDRTGVAVAVLLSAAGVERDEIVADYARTREDLDALLDQLRTLPAYKERLAALPEESLTAEPRTMELFLAHLDSEYGGATGYLAAHGVGGDLLEGLRRTLLEG